MPTDNYTIKQVWSVIDAAVRGVPIQGGSPELEWFRGVAQNGPEYYPGQTVFFEVSAEAAGTRINAWTSFVIVGVRMDSDNNGIVWRYDLSKDPPGAYHFGRVHVTGARANELRTHAPT